MKRFRLTIPIIFIILFVLSSDKAYSQEEYIRKGWGIGASAGLINATLATGGDFFFEDINPFLLKENNFLSLRLNFQYDFSPFESARLDISNGKFSVITNYAGWPELAFKNDFLSASASAQLSLMRYLGVPPYPLNIYGKFGFGLRFNNISAFTRNEETNSNTGEKSTNNSFYTVGGGIRLYVSSKINFFTEYDLFVSNNSIIDSEFISSQLNSDFKQTSNRWRGLQAGIQIKFHRQPASASQSSFPSLPIAQESASVPFTDYFTTIRIDKPAIDSLDGISNILTQLSQENDHRFNSFSDINEFSYESDTLLDPGSESENDIVEPEQNMSDSAEMVSDILLSETSEFGTTGEWNDNELTGYTIVVYSLVSINQANNAADNLRQSGYRVLVLPSIMNNISYYRVAIGQYETRYSAIQAANQLPSPLRDQYFLMSLP